MKSFVLLFLFGIGIAAIRIEAREQTEPLTCDATADCAPTSEAIAVFQKYQDAFNRHDTDAVASFWVLDEEPAAIKKRLARWKGEREFEAATHAVFRITAKALGGDNYEITQVEDCDFYRELGTGAKTSKFTVHLKDGKFEFVKGGDSTDAGKPYGPTKSEFKTWIQKNKPDQAAVVLKDGDFTFNGANAGTILKLVREWRATSK